MSDSVVFISFSLLNIQSFESCHTTLCSSRIEKPFYFVFNTLHTVATKLNFCHECCYWMDSICCNYMRHPFVVSGYHLSSVTVAIDR